jgi:hypothetical protein
VILPQHSQTISITSDVETISSDTVIGMAGSKVSMYSIRGYPKCVVACKKHLEEGWNQFEQHVLILFLGVSIVTGLAGVSGGFKWTCMLLRGIVFSTGILLFMNCRPWLAFDSCSFLPMSFWFEVEVRWFSSFSIHN